MEFFRHLSQNAKIGSFLQNGESSYTSLFIFSYTIHCQRNISNANNISTINARTNQYFNSFLPSTIRDWNSHSEQHINSTSFASFKHTLNQTNISVLKYFFVGDRHPKVLHTRLRTKGSALNYEIYLKNLTGTPFCRCGNIETSEHFFTM